MASVFLSYDRDDAARARHFASMLEKAGHQVWWDLHVRSGSQFAKVIEEALKAADVVVVLWSRFAVESAWVRDEAGAGRDTGRLVPVTIDGTEPPLGFRQFQTIDLSHWKGRGSPAALRTLLADIEATAGTTAPSEAEQKSPPGRRKGTLSPHRGQVLALFGMLSIVAAGTGYWLVAGNGSAPPTIAVAAADGSRTSQRMARDLLVDLGNVQSVKSGSMMLVDGAASSPRPDLQLQIADASEGGKPSASVALLEGRHHGVLWSQDLQAPTASASEFKQQLAFTAGRVLECALDGVLGDGKRLPAQTLKTYLNACAQLSDISIADPTPVIPMLRQVTVDAPRFLPAWSKLLLAQATISDLAFTNGTPDVGARTELRRMISEARSINPALAEADVAEAILLPAGTYRQQLALIDRAVVRNPDNPQVLSFRSAALAAVGRMDEAVDDAARASQLDQLSPALTGMYVTTLEFAGHIDSARDQLARLEKLWPGTATAEQARYTFYLRYGDPKVAQSMSQAEMGSPGVRDLIEARIDPSLANVERLVEFLRARKDKLGANAGPQRLSYYTLAMGTFHQHDELFDTLMHWPKADDLALISSAYFRPELHEFRKEPRFLLVMKRAQLLDYWRSTGKWPDFCFEADLPYDCKQVAAKLG